jgi:DNA-binding SARP family transcriptional activator
MLRLSTFGGVVLRAGDTPHQGAASQRRRLALLVLLAASWRRPISRDRLVSYFWPEADSEHARHALGQALHAIQRALGVEGLFLGTSALQLNPAVVSSDVAEFEAAIAEGQSERAVALYAGPFLDGFHVDGLLEFERWVDAERARHAHAYAEALEGLAGAAAARRDYRGAAGWWRRLVATEPLSSRYTMALMQALGTLGDRPGALQVAAVHESLVRQELGTPPDPAVLALAEQLRSGAVVAPAQPTAGPAATAASEANVRTARERAHQRQREWAERVFGARLHLEQLIAVRGAVATYAAYDRGRSAAVELNLVSPGVAGFADRDVMQAAVERVQALDDPHVVPLYECGWVDDALYFISARPDAPTLRDLLTRERQLSIEDALTIADGVAAALVHAHQGSVRHGNLRPKHVLVAGGCTMVRSFGIIDAISLSASESSSTTAVRLGSPEYLSPEQLAGDSALDTRVDLYALGCILYEMLAGEVPFASANRRTLIASKLTQPPPSVRAVRDSVPPDLDAIVRRCLARSPSDRHRTAAELRDALAAVRQELTQRR